MKCLNCPKQIKQSKGRRKKLYCSAKCRTEYFRKKQKASDPNRRGPGRPKKEIIVVPTQSGSGLVYSEDRPDIIASGETVKEAKKNLKTMTKVVEKYEQQSTTSQYPSLPYDLKKLAESGVDDVESFKRHIEKTKMTPGERSMILSKLK